MTEPKKALYLNAYAARKQNANRIAVWAAMKRLGDKATKNDLAKETGLSSVTCNKHRQAIRAGWTPEGGGK